MTAEYAYRSVPDAHLDRFRSLLDYAFRPEDGPDFDSEDRPDWPEIFEPRGLYAVDESSSGGTDPSADDLAVACGYYRFTARIRGDWHAVGGVSAVASPPERRRRGHVATLLDSLHSEFREEGIAFAALWPFEYAFYRRFGYATVHEYAETTLPPEELSAVAGEASGRFARLSPDDWEALDAVHRAWATEPFGLRRTEGWWRRRAFRGWRQDPYVYGWYDDAGELRGYVIYDVERDDEERELDVRELAYADEAARRQLLRFCRDHDSQVDRVSVYGPLERRPRLLGAIDDPRAATVTVEPGPMIRIVDVSAAIEALSYPSEVAAEFSLGVEDDRYEWNAGTFAVSVADGAARCERVDGEPDASLPIGALSQLATGARSAPALFRDGDLAASSGDGEILRTLDRAWPAERGYLREGF